MSSADRPLARAASAFAAGTLFGAGVAIAGMTDPAKVLNFLDVAGTWDPSLLLVMAAAVGVTFVAVKMIMRRPAPVLDELFHLPSRKDIDRPLLAGAALFGVGWGLAGYCPGPALASLGALSAEALLFVAAMAGGMLLHEMISRVPRGGEPRGL